MNANESMMALAKGRMASWMDGWAARTLVPRLDNAGFSLRPPRLHRGRARQAAPDSRRRGAAGQARVAIIVGVATQGEGGSGSLD